MSHPPKAPERIPIYYDAEFTGLHSGTDLISIGFYSPKSGAYFYAEFDDYDETQVDTWLKEHVISNLVWANESDHHSIQKFYDGPPGHPMGPGARSHLNIMMKGSKEKVKDELLMWMRYESEAYNGQKLQIFTDCYAYDWVLLNDLICEDGKALNLPGFIDYIPIDLSTALWRAGIDPDVNREEYIGQTWVDKIRTAEPFNEWSADSIKHNSLWDAIVAYVAFDQTL